MSGWMTVDISAWYKKKDFPEVLKKRIILR